VKSQLQVFGGLEDKRFSSKGPNPPEKKSCHPGAKTPAKCLFFFFFFFGVLVVVGLLDVFPRGAGCVLFLRCSFHHLEHFFVFSSLLFSSLLFSSSF
jgi:hypothetical protein